MPRVGLYLTDPQVKKLKELSKKTGLTISDLIRRSLDDWLEKYEEKERKRKRK
jgi:Arc/MetJ-type ribon-helix-helix transcriptional regulator